MEHQMVQKHVDHTLHRLRIPMLVVIHHQYSQIQVEVSTHKFQVHQAHRVHRTLPAIQAAEIIIQDMIQTGEERHQHNQIHTETEIHMVDVTHTMEIKTKDQVMILAHLSVVYSTFYVEAVAVAAAAALGMEAAAQVVVWAMETYSMRCLVAVVIEEAQV